MLLSSGAAMLQGHARDSVVIICPEDKIMALKSPQKQDLAQLTGTSSLPSSFFLWKPFSKVRSFIKGEEQVGQKHNQKMSQCSRRAEEGEPECSES